MAFSAVWAFWWMPPRFRLARQVCAGWVIAGAALCGAPATAGQVFTHWIMPIIPVPEAERPAGPNVFGTVALPVRPLPPSARWAKLMTASLNQPALDRLTTDARSLAPEQILAFVQVAVNHKIRSKSEITNCSDDGYWAPAQETLARGLGDCFDVAIAKMEALRLIGFRDRDMYLTTGRFRDGSLVGKGRESVGLLVRIGDQFWLLPEHSDRIFESGADASSAEFTPVVTYGVGMTWVHGRVVPIASLGAVMGTVAQETAAPTTASVASGGGPTR